MQRLIDRLKKWFANISLKTTRQPQIRLRFPNRIQPQQQNRRPQVIKTATPRTIVTSTRKSLFQPKSTSTMPTPNRQQSPLLIHPTTRHPYRPSSVAQPKRNYQRRLPKPLDQQWRRQFGNSRHYTYSTNPISFTLALKAVASSRTLNNQQVIAIDSSRSHRRRTVQLDGRSSTIN